MSDNKLQELISTLKKQGIESGEQASRQILENAQKEAAEIVAQAKSEADTIVAKAREAADAQLKQLHSSMETAATLLITNLKRAVEENLVSLPLKRKVSEHLGETNFLKELITLCVREYMKSPGRIELDVLVPKEHLERLGDFATTLIVDLAGKENETRLKINLKSGETPFGFMIGKAGDAVTLDFTDDAFLELFLRYLSPRFHEFFKTIDVRELTKK